MATRTRRTLWIVAACVTVAVLVAFAVTARTMLARVPTTPVASDNPAPRKHDRPQAEPRAAKLRDDAEAACREGDWRKCENKLNHAQKLDPPGEDEPRVQKLRSDLDRALRSDGAAAPKAQDSLQ
jgi:hypothetical protein